MADEKTAELKDKISSEELSQVSGGMVAFGREYKAGEVVRLECHSCGGMHDFVCTGQYWSKRSDTVIFECSDCHKGQWGYDEYDNDWGWIR